MIHKILLSFLALFVFNTELLWSQNAPAGPSGAGASGGQAPSVPSPGDFPQYIVTPREDLDNYEYSNMHNTNFEGNRENLGNFGKPNVQQNNVEINAELQKMEEERKKSTMPIEGEDAAAGFPEDSGAEQPAAGPIDGEYVQPTQKISLYRWYDSDGILHVTDDFGSIPPEYQDSAFKGE